MASAAIDRSPKRAISRMIGVMLAVVLAFMSFSSLTPAAFAAETTFAATVWKNNAPLAAGDVVTEGDTLELRVNYQGEGLAGTEHTIELGASVAISCDSVPAGNDAIESITCDEATNNVTVKFKNEWPAGTDQGYFVADFTIKAVEHSGEQNVDITVDGEKNSTQIVVKEKDDEFENVEEGFAKAASPGNLDSFVKVEDDGDGNIVFAGLDDGIIGTPITYTLTVNTPKDVTRPGFPIADVLPAGLSYVGGSFSAALTTWDNNGYNKETNPFAFVPAISDQNFVGSVNLEGPSILTITYQATVATEADRQALENDLRAQFVGLNGSSGGFGITLTNTATFGTDTVRTASVGLSGSIPGPGIGNAFSKNASWQTTKVLTDDDGNIVDESGALAPVGIDYTLGADLSQWDGHNNNFKLDRNVVIEDVLPTQASWKHSDADFLTVVESATGGVTSLALASDCPATVAAFAAEEFVGQYCVDGQKLMINVGQNEATNIKVAVKAQLHTVEGLTKKGNTTVQGGTSYDLRNVASFTYRDGDPYEAGYSSYPIELPKDNEDGYNDTEAFTKISDGKIQATQGEALVIPYTFTANTGVTGVSAADSRIVDYVDTEVFDLSDLSAIDVTGAYAGAPLDASHFTLELGANGELEVALNEAGRAVVDGLDPGQVYSVTLHLVTFPFDGKQTIDVTNRATLFGEGTEPLYWSENEARATSFGNEAEVRKHIYDRGDDEWTQTLKAAVDADGQLVQPNYVYRVQLIGHGSFNGTVLDVKDVLPAGIEFLGFVTEADAATGENPIPGPVDIGASLEAVYDPDAGEQGTITLHQANGVFPEGGEASAYFAVRVVDGNAPIVNSIGKVKAVIDPVGEPSVDIEKWSETGDKPGDGEMPEYDTDGALMNPGFIGDFDEAPGELLTAGQDKQIRFTISNDGDDSLINVQVTDKLDSGVGVLQDLNCVFPDGTEGAEWAGPFVPATQFECTATLPALKAGEAHANTARVIGTGETWGTEVTDEDSWNGHVPEEDKPTPKPEPGPDPAPNNGGAKDPADQPVADGKKAGALSETGAASMVWIGAAAVLLVTAGGVLLMLRRRKVSATSDTE